MPRAEVGSTKYISNQMKSKGLQRLRWYCQGCSRQMRDENGFKCHVASESHVRQMQLIGEDPRKAINDFSRQLQNDFVQLLKTGHGEKTINANHFYQEYIAHKEHIHMNATRWTSLTEFVKHLGREGIVRVEEDEKNNERGGASGLMLAWIDNSPEALRRQDAMKKRERQDRGDEEREQRLIQEQIRRARRDDLEDADVEPEELDADSEPTEGIKRREGEKIVLSFGSKKVEKPPSPPLTDKEDSSDHKESPPHSASPAAEPEADLEPHSKATPTTYSTVDNPTSTQNTQPSVKPIIFGSAKPKNVFAAAPKKNAFAGPKKVISAPGRPMSAAERIMKEEMERKRQREMRQDGGGFKKPRLI